MHAYNYSPTQAPACVPNSGPLPLYPSFHPCRLASVCARWLVHCVFKFKLKNRILYAIEIEVSAPAHQPVTDSPGERAHRSLQRIRQRALHNHLLWRYTIAPPHRTPSQVRVDRPHPLFRIIKSLINVKGLVFGSHNRASPLDM